MKSKWFSILAGVAAALIPLGAWAQSPSPATPATEQEHHYQVFAGVGYTSLNQVNQSRYGLIGGDVSITRNWGRFFGVTADGTYYPHSVASGNPGNPSVYYFLFGPEVHGHILENWSVFGRALLGGAHTGGESMTPNISFAGGAGGGLEYDMNSRWSLRAYGDDIASAFSVTGNSSQLGYSPHTRRNSRAGVGVAFRF